MIDKTTLWAVIILLGIGSFGLRFAFIGLIGNRDLPEWMLRHLRYTAVAILPGLVAPLVVWPEATGGVIDAPRLMAAVLTVITGFVTRSVSAAIAVGAGSLLIALYFMG
ncbi:hypothetical protein MNBD_ALPHA07-43 [hydrothermal vent metagenome]|uniref:Transmembrane protein n=1 Tax=hydrothermal vent metagenome TaxID=652676 RepID=A0A3B0RSZ6_9ZZZZ